MNPDAGDNSVSLNDVDSTKFSGWRKASLRRAKKSLDYFQKKNRTSDVQLLEFKLVPGGFMPFWTKHYYDENIKRFYKKKWKFFALFKIVILIRVIKILSLYKTENYSKLPLHLYLGTFAQFMGGPLHYTELIAFFWSLSESMMYFLCICRSREEFGWLKIFVFLNKDNIPSTCFKNAF